MNTKHSSAYLPNAKVADGTVRVSAHSPAGTKSPTFIFCLPPISARARIGDVELLQRFERERAATTGQDAAGARRAARLGVKANDQNRAVTTDC
jgi:hypothetical protein